MSEEVDETAASPALTIGQRLAARRKKVGLSQQQVADAIKEVSGKDLTRAAYAQWEVTLTTPDVNRIRFAAQVLGVSPAYLAFGDDDPTQDDNLAITWIPELAAESGKSAERWAIPRLDVERLGVEEGRLRMLRSPRDETSLRVRHGDALLVDASIDGVTQPGMYVLFNGGQFELVGMALKPSSEGAFVAVKSGPVSYEAKAGDLDVRGRVLAGWVNL